MTAVQSQAGGLTGQNIMEQLRILHEEIQNHEAHLIYKVLYACKFPAKRLINQYDKISPS